MSGVEGVATLSLIYREHHNAHHSGADGVLEDLEVCPGEVNLATMIGSEHLDELDWLVVRAMGTGGDLNPLAADLDAVRAEALLHAWPVDAPPPDGPWTLPFGADRWAAVEEAMQKLRGDGLTTSRDRVGLIAEYAFRAETGMTYDEYTGHEDEYDFVA